MNVDFLRTIFQENIEVIIYGAGERGKIASEILHDFGIKCIGFIDNDIKKQGTEINEIKVYPHDWLKENVGGKVLLISMQNSDKLYDELKAGYIHVFSTECVDLLLRLTYVNCEKYGYTRIEEISHFGSPYPDLCEALADKNFNDISDIDFNMEMQKKFYEKFLNLYKSVYLEKRGGGNKRRYYENNTTYGVVDALVLYGMIQIVQPSHIIEIGSGFSSAVLLDTNEYCFDNRIELNFIEPYPQRLMKILKETDSVNLQEKKLQDVDFSEFKRLKAGDILLVDSSHMVKRGSDVNCILFNILPQLESGVYIHFHDITKDFEYPISWLQNGWVWNESYLIRAFLMNNDAYEVIFFCDMWNKEFEKSGLFSDFIGGANIWIRKL